MITTHFYIIRRLRMLYELIQLRWNTYRDGQAAHAYRDFVISAADLLEFHRAHAVMLVLACMVL